MDRAQEEAIQRITAHYVDALRSGRTPKLSDYLTRYPRYAAEISDFVAYFHAVEKDLPAETGPIPELPPEFCIAMKSALTHIAQEQAHVSVIGKSSLVLPQQMVAEEQAAYQLSEQSPDLDEK